MFLFSLDNSLIFHGNLFGHKIAPNSTSNTPSSGNILADSSDGILKEEHRGAFLMGLQHEPVEEASLHIFTIEVD